MEFDPTKVHEFEDADALLAALAEVPAALAAFESLSAQNRYAITHRLHNLKTEAGRRKRIAAFVELLAKGEAPYS